MSAICSPAIAVWTGGSIEVKASASSGVALTGLKLWGNGAVFGTVPCSGTTCTADVWWVTGSLAPAAYQVQVVATDSETSLSSRYFISTLSAHCLTPLAFSCQRRRYSASEIASLLT